MKKCCTLKKENNTNVRLDRWLSGQILCKPAPTSCNSHLQQQKQMHQKYTLNAQQMETITNKVRVHCLNLNLLI